MGNPSSLGGVALDEVKEFAESIGAPPTEAGASLTSRFSRHVSDLIVARIPRGETGQFSVFLRSEALLEDAQRWKSVENRARRRSGIRTNLAVDSQSGGGFRTPA